MFPRVTNSSAGCNERVVLVATRTSHLQHSSQHVRDVRPRDAALRLRLVKDNKLEVLPKRRGPLPAGVSRQNPVVQGIGVRQNDLGLLIFHQLFFTLSAVPIATSACDFRNRVKTRDEFFIRIELAAIRQTTGG